MKHSMEQLQYELRHLQATQQMMSVDPIIASEMLKMAVNQQQHRWTKHGDSNVEPQQPSTCLTSKTDKRESAVNNTVTSPNRQKVRQLPPTDVYQSQILSSLQKFAVPEEVRGSVSKMDALILRVQEDVNRLKGDCRQLATKHDKLVPSQALMSSGNKQNPLQQKLSETEKNSEIDLRLLQAKVDKAAAEKHLMELKVESLRQKVGLLGVTMQHCDNNSPTKSAQVPPASVTQELFLAAQQLHLTGFALLTEVHQRTLELNQLRRESKHIQQQHFSHRDALMLRISNREQKLLQLRSKAQTFISKKRQALTGVAGE